MAEFFVYSCRECGAAYPGALEVTEPRHYQQETTGLCAACLERLFALAWGDRAAARPPGNPSATPMGELSLGE